VTTPLGCTTLRIVDPASGTELLNVYATSNQSLICLNSVDLGFPNVRSVQANISGAHGVTDTTRYFGDRAITAEMTLPQGPAADTALESLAPILDVSQRFYAYVQRPGWSGERRALVRVGTFTCPPGVNRKAQIGWVAPAGLLEDSLLQSVVLNPQASASGGFAVPMQVPLVISGGLVAGASLVNVGGTAPAPPLIDIYGPCSDPLVRCVDTGEQLVFTGLSIADGDFLHIDVENRTILLNGDPSQSRYNRLDVANSSWWSLPARSGVQVVFSPNTPSGNCQAVLAWRSRYIT
jgi:hypothetical protein